MAACRLVGVLNKISLHNINCLSLSGSVPKYYYSQNASGSKHFKEKTVGDVLVVTLDSPGVKVNSLNTEVMSEIQSILRRIQSDSSIKSAVIISGKPGCFIAGADITMLAACKTADQVKQISKSGQQILAEIEASPKPIVAAISGSCLGGGLEVEKDTNNFLKYKLLKEAGIKYKLSLKPNVVPHIFHCQPDRHLMHTVSGKRELTKKKEENTRKKLVDELLQSEPSTSSCAPVVEGAEPPNDDDSDMDWCEELVVEDIVEAKDPVGEVQSSTLNVMEIDNTSSLPAVLSIKKENIPERSNTPKFRSTGIQATTKSKNVSTSPPTKKKILPSDLLPPVVSPPSTRSSSPTIPSIVDLSFRVLSSESESSTSDEGNQEKIKRNFRNVERVQFSIEDIERDPRMYLGLDPENIFLLEQLENFLKCKRVHVLMVLRKIRLNETLKMLGHVFCVSESTVSRIIHKHVPNMARLLCSLIIWPERNIIYSNLPVAFRANFSKVESIIDCFEIQIEKPTKPVHQAQTWSEYKKCNTVKYLISCTPDGNINFVSKGYGGRASDMQIVKECGYLNKLKPGTVVMADRGFKALETLLSEKRCSLLRPPSVSAGVQMSKEEARFTKQIASLRVHVERVINRVRNYSFLSAHSCFHHELLSFIDYIVIISCGLSNLQGPLLH